jgi:hypothetical protein
VVLKFGFALLVVLVLAVEDIVKELKLASQEVELWTKLPLSVIFCFHI